MQWHTLAGPLAHSYCLFLCYVLYVDHVHCALCTAVRTGLCLWMNCKMHASADGGCRANTRWHGCFLPLTMQPSGPLLTFAVGHKHSIACSESWINKSNKHTNRYFFPLIGTSLCRNKRICVVQKKKMHRFCICVLILILHSAVQISNAGRNYYSFFFCICGYENVIFHTSDISITFAVNFNTKTPQLRLKHSIELCIFAWILCTAKLQISQSC